MDQCLCLFHFCIKKCIKQTNITSQARYCFCHSIFALEFTLGFWENVIQWSSIHISGRKLIKRSKWHYDKKNFLKNTRFLIFRHNNYQCSVVVCIAYYLKWGFLIYQPYFFTTINGNNNGNISMSRTLPLIQYLISLLYWFDAHY